MTQYRGQRATAELRPPPEMIPLKRAALVAACLSSPAQAAVVEAGSVTDVTVAASLYDLRVAADGGCDPAGCTAALTRVSHTQNQFV